MSELPAVAEPPTTPQHADVRAAGGAVAHDDPPRRLLSNALLATAFVFVLVGYVGGLTVKALLPRPAVGYPLMQFEGAADVDIRQLPPPPTPPVVVVERNSGWQLFFANDSHKVAGEQRQWLRTLAQSLRECDAFNLRVSGLASSARYASDSDARNILLANKRSKAVHAHLVPYLDSRFVELVQWPTYAELEASRNFQDARQANKVENPAEFLNRRVDIELRKDSACPFILKAAALALPALLPGKESAAGGK